MTTLARHWIPEGDAGVAQTLQKMRALIEAAAIDPDVRRAAVTATAYLSHSDQAGELDAVAAWILARADYRPDPIGSEWLQEPRVVLAAIAAGERPALDCDDLTMLSLSMLGAIGFPVMLEVVATQPDRVLDHVRGLVLLPSGWEVLDLAVSNPDAVGPDYRSIIVPVAA